MSRAIRVDHRRFDLVCDLLVRELEADDLDDHFKARVMDLLDQAALVVEQRASARAGGSRALVGAVAFAVPDVEHGTITRVTQRVHVPTEPRRDPWQKLEPLPFRGERHVASLAQTTVAYAPMRLSLNP